MIEGVLKMGNTTKHTGVIAEFNESGLRRVRVIAGPKDEAKAWELYENLMPTMRVADKRIKQSIQVGEKGE